MSVDKVKSSMDYFSKESDWNNDSFLQVYEEFLNLIYWVKGFDPLNVLEVGTRGTSFFLLSKFSRGKKAAVNLDNLEDRPSQLNSGGIGRKISVEKRLEENGENAPTMKNNHPTVKPTDLMRYLINLVTPPNGTILDPFMGSGSTGKAAVRCGVNFIGIEKEQEYMDIASARIEHEKNKPVQTKLFDANQNTDNQSIPRFNING